MTRTRIVAVALLLAVAFPTAVSADRLVVPAVPEFVSTGDETIAFDGHVYFAADDGVHGNELWRTDGTAAGTTLVRDFDVGSASDDGDPSQLTAVGNRLFLRVNSTDEDPGSANIYVMDAGGSPALTSADGNILGAVGDTTLVRVYEPGPQSYGLYALGQTGTAFTKINPAGHNISPEPVGTVGGVAFFASDDSSASAHELWKTNGTPGGTGLVKDIYPGSSGSGPADFVATGNRAYFEADDGTNGNELYVTDGTEGGTQIVQDHHPGPASTSVSVTAANGNTLFYTPNDPTTGVEPWRTDGTPGAATVVKDLVPGTGSSSIHSLAPLGTGFVIVNSGGAVGSDGTDAGTFGVADVSSDGNGAAFLGVTASSVYFRGGFSPFGGALWRTDGTVAGSFALTSGLAGFDTEGSKSLAAGPLRALGDKVIFFGHFPGGGTKRKLYVLDTTQPDLVRQATTQPSISGTPAAGQTLTGDPGTWVGEPSEFDYEWLRNGARINNAPGTTYKLNTSSDVGAQITFRVIARGVGRPNVVSADSNPVTVGGAVATPSPAPSAGPSPSASPAPSATPALTVSRRPKLKGAARVGAKLRLRLPALAQSGVKLSFRWFANGKRIKKQSKSSLKLKRKLKGKRISAKITVTKAGYRTLTLTVGPTGKVKGRKG